MKYELTKETKTVKGTTLYRIKALKDFGGVKKGDLGGWIESERNLYQEGKAWVYGNAYVSGNAEVCGDAKVFGKAWVSGQAEVSGNAWVSGILESQASDEITKLRKDKERLDWLLKYEGNYWLLSNRADIDEAMKEEA